MKHLLSIVIMTMVIFGYSQVGINTSTPKATLHIQANTVPNNTDGVIFPAVTTAQRLAMGTAGSSTQTPQSGQTVYDTDEGTLYFYMANYSGSDCSGSGYQICKWKRLIKETDLSTGTLRTILVGAANVALSDYLVDGYGTSIISSYAPVVSNVSNVTIGTVDSSKYNYDDKGGLIVPFTFLTPIANTNYIATIEDISTSVGAVASAICALETSKPFSVSYELVDKTPSGFNLKVTNDFWGANYSCNKIGFNIIIQNIISN